MSNEHVVPIVKFIVGKSASGERQNRVDKYDSFVEECNYMEDGWMTEGKGNVSLLSVWKFLPNVPTRIQLITIYPFFSCEAVCFFQSIISPPSFYISSQNGYIYLSTFSVFREGVFH